ncbi:methyl-accepting chemotaxis protein [Cohnella cellulosilytica]|uniref:Methyl-accepting chemotaxis protein n=1 Tax=Cohnella cellulosilytica TaxID=986710 RepID=A0ABW2FBZ0_9BACL
MAFEADRRLNERPDLASLLAQASEQIRTISLLVRSLGGRTKELSRNVAVEAARAGPRGAGFASVSREAESLSEDAAIAARQIEALGRQFHAVADEALRSKDGSDKLAPQSEQTLAALTPLLDALQGCIAEIAAVETELESLLRTIGEREQF